MTRRIVRTVCQVVSAAALAFLLIFLLDRNFRVLPTAIHEHMPQHHPGLIVTDITVTKCSALSFFHSCKLDPRVWHRIDKDLYLGKRLVCRAYVHVRRMKEEALTAHDKVVVDVSVGRLDPLVSDESWEPRPSGIWIRRSSEKHASDSDDAVTAIDVLFGDDAVEARAGWRITGPTPLLLSSTSKIPSAHITVRRRSPHDQIKPQPRIGDNGMFKIVQLADLHLSTGLGYCRDAVPEGYQGGPCEADPRTLDFVQKVIDSEKPDLVVLSGDQVNGDTAPDAQTAIFKYVQLLSKRHIPYVSIFGNHDDEGSLSRSAQMRLIEALPYSLSRAGPEDVDGVGNYYVEVLSRGKSSHSALTIYLLDSHAYSPDEKKYPGYDWIKQSQIDWFRKTAQSLKKQHREYTHVHMDIAFIHIPLPEYRDPQLYYKGEWREECTAPNFNSGFHNALVEEGVVMLGCGHDHANEYCTLSLKENNTPALSMCYGGGAGFGGYGGYGGFHRKIRVFDFDMNEARITTWKRVEYGQTDERLDEQIIVDAGRPVADT